MCRRVCVCLYMHVCMYVYSYRESVVYNADDNYPGHRISEEDAVKMGEDSYIFIYTKCQ